MAANGKIRQSPARAVHIAVGVLLMAVYVGAVIGARSLGPALYWIAGAAAVALAFLSSFWTAKLDEVAQHAHVQAWFWGGMAGLAISLAGFFALAATRGEGPVTGEDRAFILGFALALVPPVVGYLAWWAHFWLRRR